MWKNIKHDRIVKIGVTSKDELKMKATDALRRLQKLPAIVRGFFHGANLAYIKPRFGRHGIRVPRTMSWAIVLP